nr:hypothetical protein [Bacilli bacterium]
MNKININGREYILLGTVNTGKREYVYILNGKTVELYKKTLDGYVMPNKDLTLEGNVGGSLTELNENIYLSSIKDIMQREYIDKIGEQEVL